MQSVQCVAVSKKEKITLLTLASISGRLESEPQYQKLEGIW